jgi:hypothetical protein
MSDAHGTFTGYPEVLMPASSAKQVHGEVEETGTNNVRAYEPRTSRLDLVQALGQKHRISQLPRYEELSPDVVSDLFSDIKRRAIGAQAIGSVAAIVVSIVLLIVSANGVIIALATFASGITVSQLAVRYKERRLEQAPERSRHEKRRKSLAAPKDSSAGVPPAAT